MEVKKVPGKTAFEITLTQGDVKGLCEVGRHTIITKLFKRPLTIRLLYSGGECPEPKPWWQFW